MGALLTRGSRQQFAFLLLENYTVAPSFALNELIWGEIKNK